MIASNDRVNFELAPVAVVRDTERLAAMLTNHRLELLRELQEPNSAAGLAKRLGLPRQQVNYHLRELEKAGFLELVEERRKGNCIERVMRASALSYVVSPEVLGDVGGDLTELTDRFSSSYLLSAASRTIQEVAGLKESADAVGKRLATMTLETEVRFASAADRNAFAKELTDALAHLIVKYHDAVTPAGRCFRVTLGAYPTPLDITQRTTERRETRDRKQR